MTSEILSEDDGARDTRLLPGPAQVDELAAHEARLAAPVHTARLTKTRLVVGTAAVAAAFVVPDISLGAMDSPIIRIGVTEPEPPLSQDIWMPSAGATGPVYAAAMAADEIAPAALTFSSRSRFEHSDNPLPLEILETGSERFDLAFAGVAMPTPASITLAPLRSDRQRDVLVASANPIRTQQIAVEQISTARSIAPRAQMQEDRTGPSLARGNPGNRSVAVSNEAVEAAFAGQLDVSGGVRGALPIASGPAAPTGTDSARILPIPRPDAGLTGAREEQVELVQKSRLDARVNGVLTGSVEFEQRDATIAVRLGSVVDMLSDRFSAEELAQLRTGRGLDNYMTLEELQAAGIPISYSPAYDEIEFGIDYNDAPQAAKVQVEQIGAPTATSDAVMIDQIPR